MTLASLLNPIPTDEGQDRQPLHFFSSLRPRWVAFIPHMFVEHLLCAGYPGHTVLGKMHPRDSMYSSRETSDTLTHTFFDHFIL